MLEEGRGEVLFGYYQGNLVSMMYFCENSSAFIGQSGIYIDGLYIEESIRGKGLGTIMLSFISNLTLERGHKRLEWGCLDWNESAIRLYRNLGAKCVDIMRIYRFNEETLQNVGKNCTITYKSQKKFMRAALVHNDVPTGSRGCGTEHHPFELYLALNDIEHRRTKVKSPQTNSFIERFNNTALNELFRIVFRETSEGKHYYVYMVAGCNKSCAFTTPA